MKINDETRPAMIRERRSLRSKKGRVADTRRRPRRQNLSTSQAVPQRTSWLDFSGTRQREARPVRWRVVSLGIVVVTLLFLAVIFISPTFYVRNIEIGGLRYVPSDEIFTQSGIADYHILWVEPNLVADRIADSPSLDSVEVYVRWPSRVIVLVREREPALIWEQDNARYWVDVNGNLMLMRQELPTLVRVINNGDIIPFRCPGPDCPEGDTALTIDPDVVLGTQQLKTLRPEITVLYYDPSRGLSYDDNRGWRGHFGDGVNMDRKLVIYESIIADLGRRGLRPAYIDVSNPDAPFYRLADN